jgi:CO/xanthine dehydrogenase FAD-binding subunit
MTELLQPTELEEALALRASTPEAVPVLGATDLGVAINFQRSDPPALLDLTRIAELETIDRRDSQLRLGAAVTWTRLLELAEPGCRSLSQAARTVGAPQIRNRGTLGGNLGTASPAGDSLPPLLALGASVELASSTGRRSMSVHEFFTGPGRSHLAADELIVAVSVPLSSGSQCFAKVGQRNAMIIAACSLALAIDPETETVRCGIGSAGPVPLRAPEAERFAAAAIAASGDWRHPQVGDDECHRFGELVADAAQPIDDTRASARYRRHALAVLGRRTLTWACQDIRKEG